MKDEYLDLVFKDNSKKDTEDKKIEKAFELACDIRKFEIELFWKRGTYYWAFILASFTAYFAFFSFVLKNDNFSLNTILNLDPLSKIVLLILAGLTYFFSLAWVLVNKGSKFWQKNWEAHINELEDYISGKLYKTFLNTAAKGFNKCVLSKDAYDYSVTKVTTVSSIIILVFSFLLCICHFVLLFLPICSFFNEITIECMEVVLGFIILVVIGFFSYILLQCKGNIDVKKTTSSWAQKNN